MSTVMSNTHSRTLYEQQNPHKRGASNAVIKQFDTSASTYTTSPTLQQELGDILFKTIFPCSFDDTSVILDLGCGPGLFTQRIKTLGGQLLSIDLSQSMLIQNSLSNAKLRSDSHCLALQNESVDLVFSNLMMQWCDAQQVLAEIHRVLKPGGTAVISTLLPGSLFELQQAWSTVDNDQHIHQYQSGKCISSTLASLTWRQKSTTEQELVYHYSNARQLAKELKSIGANHVHNRKRVGLVGKGAWKKMENAYRRQFLNPELNMISATYRALTIKLKK